MFNSMSIKSDLFPFFSLQIF
uniref:Uncharacterized protein n=1 Tax=Anguilla anguilla TaxID=7936 RepID=A0A0E9Q7S7_ANGAN